MERILILLCYFLALFLGIWFVANFGFIVFGIGGAIILSKWLEDEPMVKPYYKKVKNYVFRR